VTAALLPFYPAVGHLPFHPTTLLFIPNAFSLRLVAIIIGTTINVAGVKFMATINKHRRRGGVDWDVCFALIPADLQQPSACQLLFTGTHTSLQTPPSPGRPALVIASWRFLAAMLCRCS